MTDRAVRSGDVLQPPALLSLQGTRVANNVGAAVAFPQPRRIFEALHPASAPAPFAKLDAPPAGATVWLGPGNAFRADCIYAAYPVLD